MQIYRRVGLGSSAPISPRDGDVETRKSKNSTLVLCRLQDDEVRWMTTEDGEGKRRWMADAMEEVVLKRGETRRLRGDGDLEGAEKKNAKFGA